MGNQQPNLELEMDTNFGNYMAGLIDGEGCFGINEQRQHKHLKPMYYPRFNIHLRADDLPILLQVKDFLGVGKIYFHNNIERNPMVSYQIDNVKDLMKLVEVLDVCPLRAKKAREYQIWRACVLLKQKRGRHEYLPLAYEQLRVLKEFQRGSETIISAPVTVEGIVRSA
jgi:hypothetical protein